MWKEKSEKFCTLCTEWGFSKHYMSGTTVLHCTVVQDDWQNKNDWTDTLTAHLVSMLQPLAVTSAGCATSGWRGWRGCWLHNRAAVVRVCARRVSVEDCTLAGAIRRVSQGSDPALRSSHSPASQPALCRPAAQHQRIHTTYTDTDPDTAPPSPAQTRPGPHTLPHHPLVPPDPDHIVQCGSFRDVQISVPTAHARRLARTDGWQHN